MELCLIRAYDQLEFDLVCRIFKMVFIGLTIAILNFLAIFGFDQVLRFGFLFNCAIKV